jgi:hypothetical protein
LFHWYFEPFTSPDAIDPLFIHMSSIGAEQGGDPAIPIPTEPFGQMDDRLGQPAFIAARRSWLALGRAVLADHAAGSAL